DDAGRAAARDLLTRGFAAGRNMTDPEVTGAYAVEAAGALAAPVLLTLAGTAFGSGRDWRDKPTLLPRLDAFRVADTTVDAPWAGVDAGGQSLPVPYAVRASVDLEDSSHVQLTTGGTSHRLSAAEFAELLAVDTALAAVAATTPVLLLLDGLSGPDPVLAETVARRLGRPVWWSTSPVELSAPDAAEGELPVLAPDLSTLSQPTATDWRHTTPATGPATAPAVGGPQVPATPAPGPGAATPAVNNGSTAEPHPSQGPALQGPALQGPAPAPAEAKAVGPETAAPAEYAGTDTAGTETSELETADTATAPPETATPTTSALPVAQPLPTGSNSTPEQPRSDEAPERSDPNSAPEPGAPRPAATSPVDGLSDDVLPTDGLLTGGLPADGLPTAPPRDARHARSSLGDPM
ncbi:hypothetical protein AN221_22005, partial [Streptomyces nanshensis]